MYQTIFFLYSGKVTTRTFDSYPTQYMIIASGINWDDIENYETHF